MHFLKSILRKNRNKFLQDVPIEHLSYAKGSDTVITPYSIRWYHNFIGFKCFKKDEDHLFFAYCSNDGSDNIYLPIYIGYHLNPIENEENCKENPLIVMMYGSDNASYFIRLKDEKEINKCLCFISECESYSDIRNSYFTNFYNS